MKNLLKAVFERYNYEYDFKYDWTVFKKIENEDKSENDKTNGISYNVNIVDVDINNI